MKKILTFLLTAVILLAASVKGNAQVTVDMGKDWNPTGGDDNSGALVNAASGIFFTKDVKTYTANPGSENEVVFIVGETATAQSASNKDVYKNPTSESFSYTQIGTGGVAFFEGHVTGAKAISSIKVNGTSGSITIAVTGGILFSNQSPFDVNSIIGYDSIPLPFCRAGNEGVTITTIPAGTKSFRIYNPGKLIASGDGYKLQADGDIIVGTPTQSFRAAYISLNIINGAPVSTPSISKASGSETQTVYTNAAISEIKYKWGGTATGINITWKDGNAPAGITAKNSDTEEKTFVISGTPTVAGTYEYSVIATDGSKNTNPLTGTITVNTVDAGKKKLAYIASASPATDGTDIKLIAELEKDYTVRVVSASTAATAADYANDDVVVLSCVPGSASVGIQAIKGINKPLVSLKPFQFQWKAQPADNKANWGFGAPDNVSNKTTTTDGTVGVMCNSVKVTAPGHAIFNNITLTNNEVIFATDSKNADKRIVTFMKGWNADNESKINVLAVLPEYVLVPPALAAGQMDGSSGTFVVANALATIFEIKPGSSLIETYAEQVVTTWPSKNIFIGISEQVTSATAGETYITNDFIKLVKNSVNYVLGGGSDVKQTNKDAKVIVGKEYFDITGKKTNGANQGFLIEKTTYEDGTFSSEKIFNK